MILEKATSDYLDALRSPADPLVAEMEAYAAEHEVPIVSRETARLLGMLARAAGARFVLEIGLAIGYSALHIARALPDVRQGRLARKRHAHGLAGQDLPGARPRRRAGRDPPGRRPRDAARPARDLRRDLHRRRQVGLSGVPRPRARTSAQDRAGGDRQPAHERAAWRPDVATATGRKPRSTPPASSTGAWPTTPPSTSCCCRSATAWGWSSAG